MGSRGGRRGSIVSVVLGGHLCEKHVGDADRDAMIRADPVHERGRVDAEELVCGGEGSNADSGRSVV